MIPILPTTAWREFRGATEAGQNMTCHQALVVDATGREHKCFVKAAMHNSPMPFTEAVGWLLAEALGLPRPQFAALLFLPIPQLRKHLKLDQHWHGYEVALSFCTSSVDGRQIGGRWQWLANLRKAKAFGHRDLPRIAAFDHWAENQDRHSANFLRDRSGAYIPIDNEYILFSIIWAATTVVAFQSLRNEARQVLSSAAFVQFEAAMVVASRTHADAIAKAGPSIQLLAQKMCPDPDAGAQLAAVVRQFLRERSEPGWLANELGHIA